MITIKEKKKKQTYPTYDKLFDKYKNFKKLLPYVGKKIDGVYRIILLNVKLSDVEELLLLDKWDDAVEFVIYLDQDILETLLKAHPTINYETKSNWEVYKEFIKQVSVKLDEDAMREIYKRCNGNIDIIKEEMPRIIDKSNKLVITKDDVNKCLIDNGRIYASQVIDDFLYQRRWRWQHFERLRKDIGDEYAFYAMRKYLRRLLANKNKYLNNEQIKRARVCEDIDVYTITHALLQFELASSYASVVTCLNAIERRRYAGKK